MIFKIAPLAFKTLGAAEITPKLKFFYQYGTSELGQVAIVAPSS